MTVAAVVVAHGQPELLQECLASLRDEVDELHVVDNGDGRGAAVAAAAGFGATRAENRGFGSAQNLGVRNTSHEFVLLMNPDARLVPGAVAKGVRLLQERERVGAVQGVCRAPDGRPERSQGRLLGPIHLWGRAIGVRALRGTNVGRWVGAILPATKDHIDRVPTDVVAVASLSATALLVRRGAFEDIAGFDEGFFMYGEDLDLCRRLRRHGWELLAVPWEWAVHQGGASFPAPWRREVEWWRGTLTYSAKWWTAGGWRLGLAAGYIRALTALPRSPRAARALVAAVQEARAHRAALRRKA